MSTMAGSRVSQRPVVSVPPVSGWLRELHRELRRGRHVILHGAVEDRVRFGPDYVDLRRALTRFLPLAGIELIVCYDPVDGLTFPDGKSAERFHDLRREAGTVEGRRADSLPSHPEAPPGPERSERAQRLADVEATMARVPAGQRPPRVVRPEDALPAVRVVLSNPAIRTAAVIDLLDLVLDPSLHSREERAIYAQLRVLMRETAMQPVQASVPQAAARNPVVLVVGKLDRVPSWIYDDENPLVAAVEVKGPSTVERRDFFLRNAAGFHEGAGLTADSLAPLADALANLTDGMTNWELEAVRRSSHVYQVGPAQPRELIHLHSHGPRHDPWAALKFDSERARSFLTSRVVGQDAAIDTVVAVLNAAHVGIDFEGEGSLATRPRGVFLLVGPTGTGKTELAKALAELIFDDQGAVVRIDMSEYSQEHAVEKLGGSPPGFVGHDQGGVLTNALLDNPFRVLLFDEIDKAHPRVLDRFLQILDDGRLTDGLGRTAFFNESLLVFTSNEGSAGLHALMQDASTEALPHFDQIRSHYDAAVRRKLAIELDRPELLGRLGDGILVFDVLRPEMMGAITSKFLAQLAASTVSRHRVTVEFDEAGIASAVGMIISREGTISSGGRQIRTEVDRYVRRPLAEWWSAHWPEAGQVIDVRWPEGSEAVDISIRGAGRDPAIEGSKAG